MLYHNKTLMKHVVETQALVAFTSRLIECSNIINIWSMMQGNITVCIPLNFNNLIKACFSNKKYPMIIQKRLKKCPQYISHISGNTYFCLVLSCLLKNRLYQDFLRLLVYKINCLSLFVQLWLLHIKDKGWFLKNPVLRWEPGRC